jgi:hypothetical protein
MKNARPQGLALLIIEDQLISERSRKPRCKIWDATNAVRWLECVTIGVGVGAGGRMGQMAADPAPPAIPEGNGRPLADRASLRDCFGWHKNARSAFDW